MDFRANRDYLYVRNYLIGFHNPDGGCLLRGTNYLNIVYINIGF